MKQAAPEDDMLFEQALDLVIRLQNDPGNPVARDLLRNWRARSPRHEAAWAEVAEIHGLAGKAISDRREAGRRGRRGVSRRGLLAGGAAGLAAATAGAFYVPVLILRAKADFITATGEIRRIPLADGSTATLGPESAIRLDFAATARRVELLAGMAFFEVAEDPARPFQAAVDGLTATALGTAYDVSRDAGYLTVAVDRGLVEARPPGSAAPGIRLAAGDWMTFDPASLAVERGQRDTGQIAAWRDGMIVAERETISAVIARIGRWQPGRIVLADASLGSRRISGVFDLTDPVTALEAVVQPYGGRVREFSPWLIVISSA
ncbi:FecR family protein [Inquilinus sp. CA228]|uniref:FecR family protein n=1 Tax=Inquilinus sp. CA228 TaxID=3455609 RepID=UPI003F8D0450